MGTRFKKLVDASHINKFNHVDYSVFMDWYADGMEHYLEQIGPVFGELMNGYGLHTVVRHSSIEYLAELFEGEKIDILTRIKRIGRTSLTYEQEVLCGEHYVSKAEITVVFADSENKKTPIPNLLRKQLEM